MSAIRAAASYKKQVGFIAIPKDRDKVVWTPSSSTSGHQAVELAVGTISNLQQSPATSAKASVKLVVSLPGVTAPDSYVFTFTSATGAKTDQQIVVDALRDVISTGRSLAASGTLTPHAGTPSGQAGDATPVQMAGALAIAATAANAGTNTAESAFSDSALLADDKLQKSLLQSNSSLNLRFNEFLKSKPDDIPLKHFLTQFWQSRIHLLRAYAVEKRQTQGTYNVLSVVKSKRNIEGVLKMSLSKEQIALIFQQHPLVRKIYDDLVPRKFREMVFWEKFFSSRLYKRLQGEKYSEMEGAIPEIDAYLDRADKDFDNAGGDTAARDDGEEAVSFHPARIPRFLDISGNEQDVQTSGNLPHVMMRAAERTRAPILKVLNSMSEKLLSQVRPSDDAEEGDGQGLLDPAGQDEKTFEELRLRDLREADGDNRVLLNVPEPSRFFASNDELVSAKRKPAQAVAEVLQSIHQDLQRLGEGDTSRQLIESSSSGKRRAVNATQGILNSIQHKKSLLPGAAAIDPANTTGLSSAVLESATMTSNTTIEFLSYFWSLYLSGDSSRAQELAHLVERLDRSLDRLNSVATAAETERQEKLIGVRKRVEEIRRLGSRGAARGRLPRERDVKGGKKEAEIVLNATERAVRKAEEVYKRELERATVQTN